MHVVKCYSRSRKNCLLELNLSFSPNLSLETLSLEVDREYKKLNQWYKKSDSYRLWLDSTEKASSEDSGGPEDSLHSNMERLTAVEVFF